MMVSVQRRLCWLLVFLSATLSCIVSASTRSVAAFIPSTTTSSLASCNAPPTGANYHKTLTIPIIGRQSFHLHIISNKRARLRIDGVLQVDEELDYSVRPGGAFSLLLPDRLKQVLRKFRTRLVEFGYDCTTDLPYVVVAPPLPTKIRIQLARMLEPEPTMTSSLESEELEREGGIVELAG